MHSLSKMAAISYFPSIHDSTTENKEIWAPFDPKPEYLNSPGTTPAADPCIKDCRDGAHQNSSTAQEVGAPAAWTTSGCLTAPGYRPLDAFSATAEDPGSASWGDADEICELLIRLKEIELRDMIGETSGIPQCK